MAKKPGPSKPVSASAQQRKPARRRAKKYSLKLAKEISERLAKGDAWSRIADHGSMPSQSTLYRWRKEYPEFAEMLLEAREMAADAAADEMLAVARATTPGTAAADRVKIGALQWAAGKGAPQRYGARAEAAVAAGPTRLIIRMREFEKVVGPDGRTVLREIPVEGEK